MLTSDTDIQKFAEKLVKAGREGVAWEKKKLQWVIEEQKKSSEAVKTD